jgi:hypothetical protein
MQFKKDWPDFGCRAAIPLKTSEKVEKEDALQRASLAMEAYPLIFSLLRSVSKSGAGGDD